MEKIELIEKIKKIKPTEETLKDIFSILVNVKDRKSVDHYVRWVRDEAEKIHTPQMYELIHKTYLYAGQYDFDSFMIAMEWNRVPTARFWLPRRKVLEGKHHIASQIQEFIDNPDSLYLGFSQAPGTGKSTLIKFLMAYISGIDPNSANIYCTYGDGLVKMLFDSVQAMITDTFEYGYHDIFPDVGMPEISAEYKTISYRKKGDFPTIGFISLSGSVTGRTRANKFLIVDDLVKNKEEARSPERLAKLFEDFQATLSTRMIGDDVKIIMLGTRWSDLDPIGRMKDLHGDDPRYKFIAIPAVDEEGHSNFNYEHPDRYTDEKLRDIKNTLDPVDWSCLFMQRGMSKMGLAFNPEELRYYNGTLPDGEPDNIIFTTDIAWGGGDSLSMPIAYQYGDDIYIHDVIFDKGDKTITKPRVVGKILQHKTRKGRMEANNGGDEYCDDINNKLREHNYSMNLTHKKAPTNMSKLSRIEQHAPTIRQFYFLDKQHRNREYDKFMDELCSFSFTTKNLHDDAPDSLAMLCDFIYNGTRMVKSMKRLWL